MQSAVPSTALLNKRLTAQVAELETQNKEQRRENRQLHESYALLADTNEQLRKIQAELQAAVNHLLKGRGGAPPMIAPNQGVLFDEDAQAALDRANALIDGDVGEPLPEVADEDKDVPDGELADDKPQAKKRQPSKRKIDELNLPRETVRSELPEEERVCPDTGVALIETGTRVTTSLDYRQAQVVVVEYHQVIYGPGPEIAAERKIEPISAPAPVMAVEGVTASASLLAWILCQKYVLHLPLYRQEDAFARLDVRLSRKTLCDWFLKSAFALQPVASEIERQIRAGPILHLDDTPIKCKVANETSQRTKVKQCYLWAFANPAVSGVVFRFSRGRATHDLADILGSHDDVGSIEVFVGDGYATNRSAAREAGYEVRHAVRVRSAHLASHGLRCHPSRMENEHSKPRSVPAREAALLLEEQQSSGLSIAAFAKSKNVAPWSLYNARTRERKEDGAGFSEIGIISERREATADSIELVLPSGLTLRVRSDFDEVALRRLLGLLGTC